MCMKGLTFLMWNIIMIYSLVSKIYWENLKVLAIIDRLPVSGHYTAGIDVQIQRLTLVLDQM